LNLKVSGLLFWGHAVSIDGVYWKHLPPALYPNTSVLNQSFTVGGIFSGSAFSTD
jgi:sucrose-6-phosphate hydrolase SacC (GH32 family)